MIVFVNNNSCTLHKEASLKSVLELNGITETRGIAVAINNKVIPKVEWEKKEIKDQDRITIIRATQGG